MVNPDPKRFKLKKLRGGGFIPVSNQILRWRRNRKSKMIRPEKPRQRAVKQAKIDRQARLRERAMKMFE